jgi:hypothetical protein
MPEIVRQLSGPGVAGTEHFPPMFFVKFTSDEFPNFLKDPTATMKTLGHSVDHLNVSVSDSAWSTTEKKWIKAGEGIETRQLPAARNWVWWCGYSDEMCVCYRVLGG